MASTLTRSEIARIAGIASQKTHRKKLRERKRIYSLNPTICKNCSTVLEYGKRHNTFCSLSCASTFNKVGGFKGARKGARVDKTCLNCRKLLTWNQEKFCCQTCMGQYRWKQTKIQIEKDGFISDSRRDIARKYFLEKYGHRCQICNRSQWMGQDVPLVIDHIDGNSDNGMLSNLRLICPNCDAQLPTYKGANKGNGRKYRRLKKKLRKKPKRVMWLFCSCCNQPFTRATSDAASSLRKGQTKFYCNRECYKNGLK